MLAALSKVLLIPLGPADEGSNSQEKGEIAALRDFRLGP
jgi:hypothetical protein